MDKKTSDLMDEVMFAIPEPLETLGAITATVDSIIFRSFNTTNVSELSKENYTDGLMALRVVLSSLRETEHRFNEMSNKFDALQLEIQAQERKVQS
ncbi:hypothetical protein [Enterococcus rotai]|uniref:hypothetical protein n=1 Tax=Enterococcus rotai TaxID=118060 RepID=UPI0032B41FB0